MPEEPDDVSVGVLGALYRDHRGEMEGLARQLLGEERLPESVLSAEDVVQAAFMKALRTSDQIREPRAYLYAVIRNDVRAASRQNQRRASLTAVSGGQLGSADVHVADFSDLVANRLAVYKALYDLPRQQRTAVWATKALEYTQAETAEAMQRRPGTIARHVVRAVAALRIHLTALLVAGVMALSLTGSRLLRTTQPPGSPRDQAPQMPSASMWLYFAASCLLAFGVAIVMLRLWARRRRTIQEGGTFAPRPIMERIRESLSRQPLRGSIPAYRPWRARVPDDDLAEEELPYGVVRTRTRLP
ncbi:RNA polymerase sigma factor [Streptomyces avermitilis]|uniref:RNA polymerase sigma factor n=1 Tax=Streptomyces avermitilis TaxID=33903 RepID=UPI00382945AE